MTEKIQPRNPQSKEVKDVTVSTERLYPIRRRPILDPVLAAYLDNADRTVRRFGHANFNPAKGLY